MTMMISFALLLLSVVVANRGAEPNCEELIKPLQLHSNNTSIVGKWILFEVMLTEAVEFFKSVSSTWMEFALTPDPDTFTMSQSNKRIHEHCEFSSVNVTLKNSTFYIYESIITFLPTCSHCLTMRLTSRDNQKVLNNLYLFTNGTTPSQSDRDYYRKQAGCLGLNAEHQFLYDGQTDFCDMENVSEKQTDPEHKKDE